MAETELPSPRPDSSLWKRRFSAQSITSNSNNASTSFFSGLGMPTNFASFLNLRLFSTDVPAQTPKEDNGVLDKAFDESDLPKLTYQAQEEGDLLLHEAETEHAAVEDDASSKRGSYAPLPSPVNERPRLSLSTKIPRRPSEMSPISRDPVTHQTTTRIASDQSTPVERRPRQSSVMSSDGSVFSERQRQISFNGLLSPKSRSATSSSGFFLEQSPIALNQAEPENLLPASIPSSPQSPPKPAKKPFFAMLGLKNSNRKASDASDKSKRTASMASTTSVLQHIPRLSVEMPQMARQMSSSSIGSNSTTKTTESTAVRRPKVIRTKYKNKLERDFKHLFLAQTLNVDVVQSTFIPSPPPSATTTESIESSEASSSPPISSPTGASTVSSEMSGASRVPKKPAVWAMEFSRCGHYLAAAGHDGVVRVWATCSGKETDEQEVYNGDAPANATTDRSSKRRSRAFSIVQQAPVFDHKPLWEYTGHTADVLDLSWSKNTFLLSSSMDKTVRLWHISRRECLAVYQHTDFVTSVEFHPRDDRYFLSGSLDCRLRLWCVPEKNLHAWTEVDQLITAVAFSSDGKKAMAGTYMGQCAFFVTDGLKYSSTLLAASSRGKNSKGSKITVPTSTPGHDRLLVSTNDSRVRMYNLWDNSLEAKFSGHENTSSQIRASFSSEGHFVVSGSEDGEAHIWESGISRGQEATGWLLRKKGKPGSESFSVCSDIVTCCSFAPESTKGVLAQRNDVILAHSSQRPAIQRAASRASSRQLTVRNGRRASVYSNDTASTMSDERPLDNKPLDEEAEKLARQDAIDNAILVTADQEGHIRIYRNSEFPLDKRRGSLTYVNSRLREATNH